VDLGIDVEKAERRHGTKSQRLHPAVPDANRRTGRASGSVWCAPDLCVLWFIFDRSTLDWHGFATLAAVFMTLIIQRAEDRDTQALQAKLDELLRASRSADSELAKIDSLEPEDIKRIRNES
jgi:Low affinity iron permease